MCLMDVYSEPVFTETSVAMLNALNALNALKHSSGRSIPVIRDKKIRSNKKRCFIAFSGPQDSQRSRRTTERTLGIDSKTERAEVAGM